MSTKAPSHPLPRRALLSVSDKTGLAELAQALHRAGVELISTGGTAKFLQDQDLPVTAVSDITQFPEIMGGRVKTLHPSIHGGILARRDMDEEVMQSHGIQAIDIVIVNLYPFQQTIAKPGCQWEQAVEQIDIGGPAMIRAAAKNHRWVSVLVNPASYAELINTLAGGIDLRQRRRWAAEAFTHTAQYDAAISQYMLEHGGAEPSDEALPQSLAVTWQREHLLRYGENPHQSAALYRHSSHAGATLATSHPLQGKALSYNNFLDADAAWQLANRWNDQTSCVIVKHGNPCGAALANSVAEAYQAALACDSQSAFGGIIACNDEVDEAAAQLMSALFAEVIIAPSFSEAARDIFSKKKNLRLLPVVSTTAKKGSAWAWDIRCIDGGVLVQSLDHETTPINEWQVVSQQQATPEDWHDLSFAWQVVRSVKSNAIVYAKEARTLGIGAGQMSRVDSARVAAEKAILSGLSLAHAVMASDAFFPFADSVEEAAKAGIRAIIQPGGSKRDEEVIAAADRHQILMVFTGRRHFRH